MTGLTRVSQEPELACYLEDDIALSLPAAIRVVLPAALEGHETDPAFLRGVFCLARSLAEMYGVPWRDIAESLCDGPQFQWIVEKLRRRTYRA